MELYDKLDELRIVHTHSAINIASRRQTPKTDSMCSISSSK